MTPTSQVDIDKAALARLQDEHRPRYMALLAAAQTYIDWSRVTHTARGALVFAYISPLYLRKPDPARSLPDGWSEVSITGHVCTELDGRWWTPTECEGDVARHAARVSASARGMYTEYLATGDRPLVRREP